MGIKDKAKKAAGTAAGVAVATTGLSNCDNGGAVDPLPPALQCSAVDDGQTLAPTATLSGDTVTVEIRNQAISSSEWNGVAITDVTGATVVGIEVPGGESFSPIVFELKLATAMTTTGSFKLTATLLDRINGVSCPVERTFTFDIVTGVVQITMRLGDSLPLAARHAAHIVLLGRGDGVVDLEAGTPYDGRRIAAWTVSHGTIDITEADRARWRLPEEPGIYQVQLVVDYGDDGLGFDAMTVEVT